MALTITEGFTRTSGCLDRGENLFLTGKAGTGKSTLIRHFMVTHGKRHIAVTMPTGVVALNVGGYTPHRLSSFSPNATPNDVANEQAKPGKFAKTITKLETLIIGEASMVRADLLDSIVLALQQYDPYPGRPFRRIQLVLVGDLYQLPPVVTEAETEYFQTVCHTPYFLSAENFSLDPFNVVSLETVFHQIGDTVSVDILNAIHGGQMTKGVQAALNARFGRDFELPKDEFRLMLVTTNNIVSACNRRALECLSDQIFVANTEVSGGIDRSARATGETLYFEIGAQIVLLNNDTAGCWVNGSMDVIVDTDIDSADPGGLGGCVYVRLCNGNTVAAEPYTWEITRPEVIGRDTQRHLVGSFA